MTLATVLSLHFEDYKYHLTEWAPHNIRKKQQNSILAQNLEANISKCN